MAETSRQMNFHPLIFIFVWTIAVSGCRTDEIKKDFIIVEKDLIPEGLAVDEHSGNIYVGSTYKRKIVQISPEGIVTDFIPGEMEGLWSVVGMEVDEEKGLLWANTGHANEVLPLIHPDLQRDWMTNISCFDIRQKKLVKKYELNTGKAFLNDLTVLPDGDVYATETVNNKIYKIDHLQDEIELFLNLSEFNFLNGITFSDHFHSLFVSAVEGIIKIDIETGAYKLLPVMDSINVKGIDGLAIYDRILIGHQSTRVSRFYLDEAAENIVKVEVLDTGDEFDSSTTGEISDGNYFFIVNSQIRSGLDFNNRTIKPMDSLENVIIRKMKL